MVFNSIEFAIFLPIVLLIYWRVGHKSQNRMLLAASYLFYGWWDYRFLGLLVLSTSIDYLVGLGLDRTQDDRRRKLMLLVSVVANLGILGFFKYFNFFADSTANLLRTFGLSADAPTLRIILPVGISFYTFQSMSYGFDVYRRRIPATRNVFDFALYVAYFPQLVAGPIERAAALLPQIEGPRRAPTQRQVASALVLILLGFFKKVAIADVMAPIADAAFQAPAGSSSLGLLVGLYAFALQIYGDFSGYTDIGRGASRLMGIELMENFNQPYLSRNITAFWRTWHVSLSSWLHDYLYIPLGGNRGGRVNTYRNLMVVMLLGGLWHGAAWTFVVWGGLHGILLGAHRALGKYVPRGYQGRFRLKDIAPAILTFHLVAFTWIFFRADNLSSAFTYLGGLVSLQAGFTNRDHVVLFVGAAICIFLLDIAQRNGAEHEVTLQWRPAWQGIAYGGLLLAVIAFSGGALTPFIYFQF